MQLKNKKTALEKIHYIFIILVLVLSGIIILIPSKFTRSTAIHSINAKAKVIKVDNDGNHKIGITNTGEQLVTLQILDTKYKKEIKDAVNMFTGKLDLDKVYEEGDIVLAVLSIENDKIYSVSIIDRYRINYEFILLIIFIIALIGYARVTGIKALISFVFTAVLIWKILLPGFLEGYNPIFLSFIIVSILTAVVMFLVAGFTRKGVIAFLGSLSGIVLTAILSVLFGLFFKIPGEIKPFAETLLYSGYQYLDLSNIFIAGIFIANSGAIMDIAMDIAASMDEIKNKKITISRRELIYSGFIIGRSVIGTMTTTLLLAYSGGFSTLLMVLIARGVPLINILNYQYIAGEILHTIVGSFGLVSVAPLTAIIGGLFLVKKRAPGKIHLSTLQNTVQSQEHPQYLYSNRN
ncbi:MAG: YibE/F family protein [Spirochaetales bacterium]|nr:YibE/F family protein [Spirochaetales bacterium]